MNYIQLTKANIHDEHICCALGAKQYIDAVHEKKQWLCERMEEGLVFYRLDERAKVFIEYLPAEKAWVPVEAPNYMYINCLWVSGRYKDGGHGRRLLDKCTEDAKALGMDGIVHIVGKAKYPYLSDKRYFEHMGFEVADQAEPYFELAVLKWNELAVTPAFRRTINNANPMEEGISIYYTVQCPFAAGILDELQKVAEGKGIPFRAHRLRTREEAQQAPAVWTTFSMYYNGEFLTHEILSPNKLEKLLHQRQKQASRSS
ncbi:GNAT family N-acetyltransferase [Paenibacillus ihumii]|uniref:GNAT family N-acetyltransferase n=1 Tax=Paenibacillus ihumii TaxID=687436 RepID=UPI0006D80628|nr:GNAT family N-acetyltransferase [Paenibacillus ihumii]